MAHDGPGPRMLGLAALVLLGGAFGGCWVEQNAYEIDVAIEIVDPQPQSTAGYAAFVFVQRSPGCTSDYYGESVCRILGWDSVEIPAVVTVDGAYDAGDDDCFQGLFIAAYRDSDLKSPIDYYPGDACAVQPLSDPTVREAPIALSLDRDDCFDYCYWGETAEDRP